MRLVRLMSIAALVVVAACGARRPAGETPSPGRNPDVLTLEDIQQGQNQGTASAYDLIIRMRPNWLRSPNGFPVTVFVDRQRIGSVRELSRIPLAAIAHIRKYGPSEASVEFGRNNGGGSIAVTTLSN